MRSQHCTSLVASSNEFFKIPLKSPVLIDALGVIELRVQISESYKCIILCPFKSVKKSDALIQCSTGN